MSVGGGGSREKKGRGEEGRSTTESQGGSRAPCRAGLVEKRVKRMESGQTLETEANGYTPSEGGRQGVFRFVKRQLGKNQHTEKRKKQKKKEKKTSAGDGVGEICGPANEIWCSADGDPKAGDVGRRERVAFRRGWESRREGIRAEDEAISDAAMNVKTAIGQEGLRA